MSVIFCLWAMSISVVCNCQLNIKLGFSRQYFTMASISFLSELLIANSQVKMKQGDRLNV